MYVLKHLRDSQINSHTTGDSEYI